MENYGPYYGPHCSAHFHVIPQNRIPPIPPPHIWGLLFFIFVYLGSHFQFFEILLPLNMVA